MLESQRTPISDECRLRFDDYLLSTFKNVGYHAPYRPVDSVYCQLYTIRFSIDKRKIEQKFNDSPWKLEELYK